MYLELTELWTRKVQICTEARACHGAKQKQESINYLFGGKDGLLDELVDQNGEHMVARRLGGDQTGALVLLLLLFFFLLVLFVLKMTDK